jgi:hypothetical protein
LVTAFTKFLTGFLRKGGQWLIAVKIWRTIAHYRMIESMAGDGRSQRRVFSSNYEMPDDWKVGKLENRPLAP